MVLEEFVLKFSSNYSRYLANTYLINLIKKRGSNPSSEFHKIEQWAGLCAQGPRSMGRRKKKTSCAANSVIKLHRSHSPEPHYSQQNCLILDTVLLAFCLPVPPREDYCCSQALWTCVFKCSVGGAKSGWTWGFGAESKLVAVSENISSSFKLNSVPTWVVWGRLRTEDRVWFPNWGNIFINCLSSSVPEAKHVLLSAASTRVTPVQSRHVCGQSWAPR